MTQMANSTMPTSANPSRTFSTASVASVRLLSSREPVGPARTQRATSPARPGSKKFAMLAIPNIVRHERKPGLEAIGKINCQRQARSGKFKQNTARGMRRKGPFRRPSAAHDCLRSTCRHKTATQAKAIRMPMMVEWTRNLRPKTPLHSVSLVVYSVRLRRFFEEISRTISGSL